MIFQACTFKRSENSDWEVGIAAQEYFEAYDVKFIIDENGRQPRVWNYKLINPTFNNPNVGIDLDKIATGNKIHHKLPVFIDTETKSV